MSHFVYASQGHVPDLMLTYDGGVATPTAVYRFVTDVRGSVVAVVSTTGVVLEGFEYGPRGETERVSGTGYHRDPFGYAAGGVYDELTGMLVGPIRAATPVERGHRTYLRLTAQSGEEAMVQVTMRWFGRTIPIWRVDAVGVLRR